MVVKRNIQNESYRQQRMRNNISVRKSREKTKHKLAQTAERIQRLRVENDSLSKEMDNLSRELTLLKKLVTIFIQK